MAENLEYFSLVLERISRLLEKKEGEVKQKSLVLKQISGIAEENSRLLEFFSGKMLRFCHVLPGQDAFKRLSLRKISPSILDAQVVSDSIKLVLALHVLQEKRVLILLPLRLTHFNV